MITTRLYQQDAYLAEFTAHIVDRSEDGRRLYLDRTAFYPASGGQPHDTGEIAGAPVLDVVDEERRVAHVVASPVAEVEVACRIDWERRFDHMQQHSGQHLLSAVLLELSGAQTVGFHLGSESSTIDLSVDELRPEDVLAAEELANRQVTRNLPVTTSFQPSAEATDLRRAPDREGMLRIVSIEGLDRSACGGTHVRATGEIGPILLRRLDKVRGNVRLEFLCGMRAVRRARRDFDGLARIARGFSSTLEEAPALAAGQQEALQASEKARRRAAGELARYRGRELYGATAPGPDGVRRTLLRRPSGSLDEELRAQAQGFVSAPKASFVAAVEDPPAVLLAVSADLGVNAGATLKDLLARRGGRGGGNAQLAQGTVASREALAAVLAGLGWA
ncbi:MAG: alanyl-tRNA editing protein [Bryobacterales bacterium]|nr:alanyl-tRNA editing protein [Bryobacterales bacterium]